MNRPNWVLSPMDRQHYQALFGWFDLWVSPKVPTSEFNWRVTRRRWPHEEVARGTAPDSLAAAFAAERAALEQTTRDEDRATPDARRRAVRRNWAGLA